jgi:hemerythrin superfamily protein
MSDAASKMPDIVESIRRDHAEVRTLLDRYDTAASRVDWFCHVRETLVRHEVAEEISVYPAIRHSGDPLKEVIDTRLGEQRQAEKLLAAMEKMDVGSQEFDKAFLELKAAVLGHASSEESSILPAIEAQKSVEKRRMMGERYERAKNAAPTHPHPHAPNTPPGNLVLGPVAALADRIRDAARNDDDQSDLVADTQVGS